MSPAIFAAVPYAGGLIAPIYVAIVTVIGAREIYHISTGRAFFVGLFPKVLFFRDNRLRVIHRSNVLFEVIVSMFL